MAQGNEVIIGRRYGQLAGLAAFVLVLGRLGRLLQTGPTSPRWQLILIAAAFLGGVVWWLIRQMATTRWVAIALFGLGSAILFLRISVPDSLLGGILPTTETSPALANALDQAVAQIRFGIPPIDPSAGVIAVLALVVWVVGALYTWGVTKGPTAAMVIPSIVIYLQFAIFDRTPAGLGWMTASAAMLALAVTALALERRADVGRVRDSAGRPIPVRSVTAATVMALIVGVAATAAGTNAVNLISEYGNVPWTSGNGGGYGPGGTGFSLDRFVDLRQSIISRENLLLFQVTFDVRAPQPDQIYWRLETLDSFDGVGWKRSSGSVQNYETGRQVGHESNVYQGSTTEYTHRVYIDALRQEVAPTGGVPTAIHGTDTTGAISPREFQHTEDSALLYNQVLREGDVYDVTVSYPLQNADQGALATGSDGLLTPIFALAAESGVFRASPSLSSNDVVAPRDLASFTDLPDSTPPLKFVLRRRGRRWERQPTMRKLGSFSIGSGTAASLITQPTFPRDTPHSIWTNGSTSRRVPTIGRAIASSSLLQWLSLVGHLASRVGWFSVSRLARRDSTAKRRSWRSGTPMPMLGSKCGWMVLVGSSSTPRHETFRSRLIASSRLRASPPDSTHGNTHPFWDPMDLR